MATLYIAAKNCKPSKQPSNKWCGVYPFSRMLLHNKRNWSIGTYYTMDQLWK
jgi:ATP/ADP translocase